MLGHLVHLRSAMSDWKQRVRSVATGVWIPRDGAELVALPSGPYKGRVVMYGGWHSSAQPTWDGLTTTNEIHASDDRGATWSVLSAHVSTPPTSGAGAKPLPSHTMGVCLHTHDGVDYVYWIGDDALSPPNGEVWRFPVAQGGYEGAERLTTNGPTADGSWLHKVVSYGGALYCIGGQTSTTNTATAHSHVWRSTDGGATWTQLSDAPWAGRSSIGLAVHRGLIYVVAGSKYHDTDASRVHYNDVWTFDGSTWTEILANGHGQFAGRHYHGCVSAGGRLWIFGGWNSTAPGDEIGSGSAGNLHSIFWSLTGATWTRFENQAWGGSHADGFCVTPDQRVIRAAGNKFDTGTYEFSR